MNKRIFICFVAMMAVGLAASAQSQRDTLPLTARQWNYYYTEWYDQCERFEDNGYFDDCFVERYVDNQHMSNICKYEYTPQPLKVRGLVALIHLASECQHPFFNYRLPEYMYLYQNNTTYTIFNRGSYPFQMILVDSVRWDTAAPHYLPLPQGATSDEYRYGLAYEAYFDKPVRVDSSFYIYGTGYSNTRWPIPEDSSDHYHYIPSFYLTISCGLFRISEDEECFRWNPNNWGLPCHAQGGWHSLSYEGREWVWPRDQEDMVDGNDYWSFLQFDHDPVGLYLPIVYHYEVDATSDDEAMGTVTGGGRTPEEWVDTLRAIPQAGYRFVRWHDGNTDNPRLVTVTRDTTFRAYFDSAGYYGLVLAANDDAFGTVSGGGTYGYGAEVEITATPSEVCYFVSWDDGDWHATRTVTVTQDTAFTAIFAVDSSLLGVRPEQRLEFALSPNPVGGRLDVSVGDDGEFAMEIVDIRGVVVRRGSLRGPRAAVDVSALAPGRYLMRLRSQNATGIRPFVKK